MKKIVSDLVLNPENPRKITKDNLTRLQQSIMLFPKMLYYSDIIINSDSVVLAGNQRVNILKRISKSSFLDWCLVLEGNNEWDGLNEKQKDKVIDYWKKWRDNPEVDCTLFDADVEEQKRLVYLDNKNFGEYEVAKMLQIADEKTLIGYGFDQGMFYIPEENSNVVSKTKLGYGKKINVLKFARNSIAVTREEYDALVERYENYIDDNGVDIGFVSSLLSKE